MWFLLLQSLVLLILYSKRITVLSLCSLQCKALLQKIATVCWYPAVRLVEQCHTGTNRLFIQIAIAFGVCFLWFDRSSLLCSSLETEIVCPQRECWVCASSVFLALKWVPVALWQTLKQWSVEAAYSEREWLYLFVFFLYLYLYGISWSHIMCEVVKFLPASVGCDFSPSPPVALIKSNKNAALSFLVL